MSAAPTAPPKKSREEVAAALMMKLEGFFAEKGGFSTLTERVKAIEDICEGLKGLNVKEAVQAYDKIKSRQELLEKQVKSNRGGIYVPGIENETFSLSRACLGVKMGGTKDAFEKIRGGKEFEILRAAQQKAIQFYGADAFEKASQNVSDDSLGGAFIPDQVIADVISAIYTRSIFINLTGEGAERISVIPGLVGDKVRIPKFQGGMIAYWQGEEDETAESNMKVGDVTMSYKKLGCLARLTEDIRLFASYGFEQLFRRDMARAMAKKLDYAIPYGSGGDHQPLGFMKTKGIYVYSAQKKKASLYDLAANGGVALGDTTAFQADWAGAELDFDGLDNMELTLEEADITADPSSMWFAPPRFWRRLKKLKIANYSGQTTQQPYLIGPPILPTSRLKELIGDLDSANQWPTTNTPGKTVNAPTTSTTAKFGDVVKLNCNEVVLGQWTGLQITDDGGNGKGFPSDHVYVKARLRVDVGLRQAKAIVLCPDAQMRD